jgi:hypothetical protein
MLREVGSKTQTLRNRFNGKLPQKCPASNGFRCLRHLAPHGNCFFGDGSGEIPFQAGIDKFPAKLFR